MDISTENVLMCKKAIEMQDSPKSSATMPDDVFFREMAGGEYLVGAYSEESDIWLPHIYKLQAMVKRRNEVWIHLLNRFYNYYAEEVKNNHKWSLTFDTPEKMWLAFMMKEKYSKMWNGKKWVK